MAIRIPRPQESGFPEVRIPTGASLESFGGGESTAQAMGATRHLAQQQAQYHQEKLETTLQTAADEEMNAITAEEARLTVELQKARGKDAFGASSQVLKDFDKFKEDRQKNIANPVVKQYVGQKYQRHRGQLEAFGMKYSNVEGERWQDETDQAKIEGNRNAAIANGTPERIAEAIGDTDRSLESLARRKGMPPEWLTKEKARHQSNIHAGVIDSILARGGDLAAKAYYDANKEALVGNDAIRLSRIVKNESLLGEAQRETDKIYSTYYTDTPTGIDAHYTPETEEAAMEEARKIKDPDVRAKTEELTRSRWHEIQRSREAAVKSDMIAAANQIDGGKTFDQLDPALKDRLSPTNRRILRSYGKGAVVTDDATWYTLSQMAAREDTRDKFKNMNLLPYIDRLSKEDFQEITKLQTGLLKEDGKAKKDADGIRGAMSVVTGTLGTGKDAKIPEADREGFMRVVNERTRLWKVDHETDSIPDKEVEGIVDDLLKVRRDNLFTFMGMPSGHLWLTPKRSKYQDLVPVYDKYKTLDPAEAMMKQIPENDRAYIISQFKAKGLLYTHRDVIAGYTQLIEQRNKADADAGK